MRGKPKKGARLRLTATKFSSPVGPYVGMTGTSVGTFNKDTRMEWDDGAVGPLLLGYVEYELIDPSDAAYPAPSLAVLSSRRAAREAAELARDKRAEDALLSKVLYDILGGF